MATVNLGSIKFKWKGTYSGATAYTIDDVVEYNGSSYICISNSTGNLPTNATYFEQMSQKGTDADLLNIASTAQGDIYYNNGSAIARLGAGTSGQALITGGAGANPSWGTISSGNYSVHAFDKYSYGVSVGHNGQTDYVDIAGGNYVSFTPTSTSDVIVFTHGCDVNWGGTQGADVYLVRGTSTTLGSSDTKLNYSGTHASYTNTISDIYLFISKTFQMPCTGLTVGTTYYVEQAGAVHTSASAVNFNTAGSNDTGEQQRSYVSLVHYKFN
jgi:hypothetical protein